MNPFQYNRDLSINYWIDPVTGQQRPFYDANNPLTKISGFFLNFDSFDASGKLIEDGKDWVFGDHGNVVLFGGTGHDRLFGGKGDDYLQLDDNLNTGGGLNTDSDDATTPLTTAGAGDFAYGGDGLDVLIANSGYDRMYDWGGEFNSFVAPFSRFGAPTVNRSPNPHIVQSIRDLAAAGGADQDLTEPNDEAGLFTHSDPEWRENHGGPRDPQPGNGHGIYDSAGSPENDTVQAPWQTAAGSTPTGRPPLHGGGGNDAPMVNIVTAINALDPIRPTAIEDANDPDNPRILTVGTSAVWTYLVTNPGTVPVTLDVTDDAGTPGNSVDDFRPAYISGDANGNGQLDPGETWLYTSASVFPYTVETNLYGNVGSVTATAASGRTAADSDPTYLLGNAPSLFVLKAINAADPMHPTPAELAQSAPGRALPVGTAVVWTYKVYNMGDGPIQVTFLRDDAGTPSDPHDDFSPTAVLQVGLSFNIGDTDRDGLLDTNEAWLYSSRGSGSGTATVPDWNQVYQDVVRVTDTSGSGLTPGFVHDAVGTPNSFSDNIFTGGRVEGHTRHQRLGMEVPDAPGQGRHRRRFRGLLRRRRDRSSAPARGDGPLRGQRQRHRRVLVPPATRGRGGRREVQRRPHRRRPAPGSGLHRRWVHPMVKLYRWTGTEANGRLTQLTSPAGSTFAIVNSGPVSVPWSFINKDGFTSPQAGELLRAGVDLTALFGANAPHYVGFLAETRSSSSINSTLSDFALGSVIMVNTRYTVKPGPYSNTVTARGTDPVTSAPLTATNTNFHFGVASGPQLAASAPPRSALVVPTLTAAELAPILAEAKVRWAALGVSPDVLNAYSVEIADLPDGTDGQRPTLGYASDRMTLDVNAGGFGWFIDLTPGDDVEFAHRVASTELAAGTGSPADGRIDLLTVMMHELGHVLGRADLASEVSAHDLMAEALAPGTRRLPASTSPSVSPPTVAVHELGGEMTALTTPTPEALASGMGTAVNTEPGNTTAPVGVDRRRNAMQVAQPPQRSEVSLPSLFASVWPERGDCGVRAPLPQSGQTEQHPPVSGETDELGEFIASLAVPSDWAWLDPIVVDPIVGDPILKHPGGPLGLFRKGMWT